MLCVQIPVMMTWKGREATEIIAWFQYESDPSLNSNVFQVASYVVQKHFPGKTVSFVIFFFLICIVGGWSPNWVHLARRPLTGLLYLYFLCSTEVLFKKCE
jgi:hypothetical protein